MATLELYIGKSKYTIDCENSQREKVLALAASLNERVNNLSFKIRGSDEKTVLMLCALMIEEELESLKKSGNDRVSNYNNQQNRGQELVWQNQKKIFEEENKRSVEEMILRLENLANKIKNY